MFVDDADSATADSAGLLVVVATVLGVLGVMAVASGGYALSNDRPAGEIAGGKPEANLSKGRGETP